MLVGISQMDAARLLLQKKHSTLIKRVDESGNQPGFLRSLVGQITGDKHN
jgi:hypothetical protein